MKNQIIRFICLLAFLFNASFVSSQKSSFDGLHMNLGNLAKLSHAKTRSISPENFTGEKGNCDFDYIINHFSCQKEKTAIKFIRRAPQSLDGKLHARNHNVTTWNFMALVIPNSKKIIKVNNYIFNP